MFDIDATGIAFARCSRVLHLLDCAVVYLAFLDRSGKCDDLWSPKDQVVLGQYFTWCECRRHRRRSGSLNPVELTQGQFLRKSSDDHVKIKSNKRQLSITRWLRRTIGGAGHKYNGKNLPERESEALEENTTQNSTKGQSCPDADHCLSKFAVSKQQPNTFEFLTGKNSVELDPDTGGLTWVPFFLQEGDHELDLEQVAIANAIEIPVIRVTGTAGESAGPEVRPVSTASVQMRIPTYLPKLKERFLGYRVSPSLENVEEE